MNKDEIHKFETEGQINIKIENQDILLNKNDIEIISTEIEGWVVESEDGVTVAIDTELTEDLISEGYAREFVNRVQNMRKDLGLDVMDRIDVSLQSDKKLVDYIIKFADYIKTEVLAKELTTDLNTNGFKQEWEIGDFDCTIDIQKADM